MFCHSCGKQNDDHARFCLHCGALLGNTSVPSQPAAPARQSTVSQPAQTPPRHPVRPQAPVYPVPNASSAGNTSRKKNNQRTLKIILLIVGIILVALLILFVGSIVFSFFSSLFSPSGPTPAIADVPTSSYQQETDPEGSTPAEQAEETEAVSDGNPVPQDNPYREYYNASTGFVLPESNSRYYSPSEIADLSDAALLLASAEIPGRRGQAVNDKDLQEYLDSMPWYAPGSGSPTLNTYERANQQLIDICQRERSGDLYRSNNPYIRHLGNVDAYFRPGSNGQYLDADDLEYLTAQELVLARSEILARHGVIFQDNHLQEFFCCKMWYVPTTLQAEFSYTALNDPESCNIELIELYERILNGITPALNNPYMPYYNHSSEYILAAGSNRALTEWDLAGYSVEELIIARNQIIALHGYTFSDEELLEYFLQCSWYRPSTAPGRTDLVSLSSIESSNMNFMYEYEKKLKAQPNLASLDSSLSLRIDTPYYSVNVPAYWNDYGLYVSSDGADGYQHSLAFYEKQSHEINGGGHLFTILILPESEDYTYRPSYQFICQFSDETGALWNIIAITPTDVQAQPYATGLYGKMSDSIQSILATLQLKDGYTPT